MQEAMDAASTFSLPVLPPGVRERLNGATKKSSKVPPEMTVKEYVEFLAGEPLSKEVPSQAPADAPDPMPNISIEDAVAYIEKASVEGIRVLPQRSESSASKTGEQQEDDEEDEIKAGF